MVKEAEIMKKKMQRERINIEKWKEKEGNIKIGQNNRKNVKGDTERKKERKKEFE